MSSDFYNTHAERLAEQYLSTDFEQVHEQCMPYILPVLSKARARVLDIGAGAGRDARYFAEQGNQAQVYAVEPAELLAQLGEQHTQGLPVTWLTDSLPALHAVTRLEVSFDLILLSAVWMHIPDSQRERSLRKLTNLLKPGGQIVISLRYGQGEHERNERAMYQVCADSLKAMARNLGLSCTLCTEREGDKLKREQVSWQTLVFRLPDDGSGAFPLIRHVALNDGKSATHKLALMRVLLRIADGHPGAVIRREDNRVILPAGLVALYWCHQYKTLIDHYSLYQTPNKSPNMGFMKENGWHKLGHLTASDLKVGNGFKGEEAKSVCRTLSHAVSNIRDMPCRYITFPNTQQCVFELSSSVVRATDLLFLDFQTLCKWGEFSLPEHTWTALNRYACWIEPVLVNEWAKTMQSYQGNKQYQCPTKRHIFIEALSWLEPKRTTTEVRRRFDELRHAGESLSCVWTTRKLQREYDIDHCMPFARWPNNDLWNLLPASAQANNEKRDRLPSVQRLEAQEGLIKHWWRSAWLDTGDAANRQKQRFFAEANLALPNLDINNSSVDDLFDALVLQRDRLREMQQLQEW